MKPHISWSELEQLGVQSQSTIAPEQQVTLLAFEMPQEAELWVGLDNFYVITRYNHSPLYAMAVYQLSESLLKGWQALNPVLSPEKMPVLDTDKASEPKPSDLSSVDSVDTETVDTIHE